MAYTDSVTGTDTWTDNTLPAPQDGDAADNANERDRMQQVANRLVWLKTRTIDDWHIPMVLATPPDGNTYWDNDTSGNGIRTQNNVTSAYPLRIWLPEAASGTIIASIQVYLKGASGHGALPGTMPRWKLMYRDVDTDVVDVSGTYYTDSSGSVGAYQATHSVAGPVNVTVATSRRYLIHLEGEAGANAVVGLQARSLVVAIG